VPLCLSGISTTVEDSLQITPFYAKQSQFPKSQMNVKPYNTTDYENVANWTLGENKPKQSQSNPIQTQFPKNQNGCKLSNNKEL